MISEKAQKSRKKGSVLVVALVFSMVISGMVVSYLKIGQLNSSNVNNATEHQNALYAARSGVSRCNYLITTLDDNLPVVKDDSYQFQGESNGNAYYTVITRKSATAPNTTPPFAEEDIEAEYEVVSTGYMGDEVQTLVAVLDVELTVAGPLGLDKAIITEGNLTVQGSPEVLGGTVADVHSNGDLELQNGIVIEGTATAAGTLDIQGTVELEGGTSYSDGDPYETDNSNAAYQDLPTVTATEYKNRADYWMISDGGPHHGEIYVVATGTYVSAGTFKWQLTGGGWAMKNGSGMPEGTWYAETDVSVNKNKGTPSDPFNITVITTGNYTMNGNINIEPYLDDLAVLADGDIGVNGNTGASIAGIYLSHEQIDFSGSAIMTGMAISTGTTSISNVAQTNVVTGTLEFYADTSLIMPNTDPTPQFTQSIGLMRKGSQDEQDANLSLFSLE